MPPAFRLVLNDDLRTRIESERLDAAQREFERQERVRRVSVEVLASAAAELRRLYEQPFAIAPEDLRNVADTIEGVTDVLRGEWVRSPCLQRIADATEVTARSVTALIENNLHLRSKNSVLERQLRAAKGQITKLRKQLAEKGA